MSKETMKLALEGAANYIDALGGDSRKYRQALAEQPAQQEPVAWPCLIAEADFSEDTVTLAMQCTDYKVSAGKHWLSNTPPAQQCWKCGDMDAAFQAKCNVPACGMKEQP